MPLSGGTKALRCKCRWSVSFPAMRRERHLFVSAYLKRKPSRRTEAKGGIFITLSEVLLLLTLLWDVMKGSFDIVMKLSNKEHDDNKKD